MQASVKNKEICCTGKVSSIGEIMIQTFLGKRSIKNLELRHGKEKERWSRRNNMDYYIGNEIRKRETLGFFSSGD